MRCSEAKSRIAAASSAVVGAKVNCARGAPSTFATNRPNKRATVLLSAVTPRPPPRRDALRVRTNRSRWSSGVGPRLGRHLIRGRTYCCAPEVEAARTGGEHRPGVEPPTGIERLAQPGLGVEVDRTEQQRHQVALLQTH